jgi:hypothetical protein
MNVLKIKDLTTLGMISLEATSRTGVRNMLTACHALIGESGYCLDHKTNCGFLMLIRKYLHQGQTRSVINDQVEPVTTSSCGADLLTIPSEQI